MATDCYQKFKTTYNQAIADGLSTGAAQVAAQAAMADCLYTQSTRPTGVAQPIIVSNGGRIPDTGPVHPKAGN